MKIVTISAKAQHGKDYTATLLKNGLEDKGYSVLVTHYADLLKYICKQFFDWDGKKDEYGRTLLQKVGTEGVRAVKPDYWVDFIIDILKFFPNEWDYVIIPDTRFPNEIEKMRKEFDTISVHVSRPNFENFLTEEQRQHPSETALDGYLFNHEVVNDGTPEGMQHAINNLIDRIEGE
jgi:hypothetical protein